MAGYQTTYSAGMSKMTMAGEHDPASETNTEEYVKPDPDPGHPTAADKPHEDRVPWEVVPPDEDPAMEVPPVETPPEGDTARSSETGESVLGISRPSEASPAKPEKHDKNERHEKSPRTHREGDHL